jgi:serine phosphatase RsbU (regulator of sigma subunit)
VEDIQYLKNIQIINKNNKLVIDVANNVSVERELSPEIAKTLSGLSPKRLFVNEAYCENYDGVLSKDTEIGEFLVGRIMSAFNFMVPGKHCGLMKMQGFELIEYQYGDRDITIRYIFSLYPFYKDLFLILVATLGLLIMNTFILLLVLNFIVRPLMVLKKGAYAMAAGNLKHKVKLRSKNEFGIIANFMNEVARNLEKIISDLNEKERISSELDIASRIQHNLQPQDMPELPGLEITAKTRSSTEVGGDTFDIIQVDEDNTITYIGDVTGHGVPAGLIMIMVDVLIHTFTTQYKTTKEIMTHVNQHLYPRIDSTLFMTMIMFHWNTHMQRLTYSSAGHEHIIHYHAKTQKCTVTRSGGIALGMVPDISHIVVEKEIPLEQNDAIVLYTDGITEAKNEAGEMFGLKRLVEAVEKYGFKNANGIFDRVTRSLSTFIGQAPQEDDITLIVLKYKGADPDEIEKATKKAKLSLNVGKQEKKKKVKWDWDR